MTGTIECGYGSEFGCKTCDEYGNEDDKPLALATMPEPERGTIVSVPAAPDGDPDELDQVYFIRADNDEGLWWEPLEFGYVTWATLLHETAPKAPAILDDPELATYIAELAIYKNRYSMVTCENCEEKPLGPAITNLAARKAASR